MSAADIERFVADLKSDPALLEQIKSGATGLASVVDMAKAKGYDISIDEAKAYIDEQAKQELSDEQLDAVAGGKVGPGNQVVQTTTAQLVLISTAQVAPGATVTNEVVTTTQGLVITAGSVVVT